MVCGFIETCGKKRHKENFIFFCLRNPEACSIIVEMRPQKLPKEWLDEMKKNSEMKKWKQKKN